MNVAIVISDGRVRADRLVADWLDHLACPREDLEVDLLDLAVAGLPDPPREAPRVPPRAVADLAPWLTRADGFVVVVPRQRAGPLHSAIHWCAAGWRAKPVAFAAHAGTSFALPRLRAELVAVHAALTDHVVTYPDQDAAEKLLAAFAQLPTKGNDHVE